MSKNLTGIQKINIDNNQQISIDGNSDLINNLNTQIINTNTTLTNTNNTLSNISSQQINNANKILYYDVNGNLQKGQIFNDLIPSNSIYTGKISGLSNLITQVSNIQIDTNYLRENFDGLINTNQVNTIAQPYYVLFYNSSNVLYPQLITDNNIDFLSYDKIFNNTRQISLQTEMDLKLESGAIAIADITNLQSTLDGKANTSHTHTISQITSLQTTLDGKASSSHTHTVANISDFAFTANSYCYFSSNSGNTGYRCPTELRCNTLYASASHDHNQIKNGSYIVENYWLYSYKPGLKIKYGSDSLIYILIYPDEYNRTTFESIQTSSAVSAFCFRYQGSNLSFVNKDTGAYSTASDQQKKKNIKQECCQSLCQSFLDINFKTYDMKSQQDQNDSKILGIIAQELQQNCCFKYCVIQSLENNEQQLYVDQNQFMMHCFCAIQKIIKQIQQQIKGHEKRFNILENMTEDYQFEKRESEIEEKQILSDQQKETNNEFFKKIEDQNIAIGAIIQQMENLKKSIELLDAIKDQKLDKSNETKNNTINKSNSTSKISSSKIEEHKIRIEEQKKLITNLQQSQVDNKSQINLLQNKIAIQQQKIDQLQKSQSLQSDVIQNLLDRIQALEQQ